MLVLKPLDDVQATIALIAEVTGVPVSEVQGRLVDETAEIGTNVHASMIQLGIPVHVTSKQLDAFYRETDAFLYETTVWNLCAAKQRMRDFISTRLLRYGKTSANIFCFGDGLGFDSTFLALQGHNATYFDPSVRCREYARRVFACNNAQVTCLDGLEDIESGSLDSVVCLDVLEHVPQPQRLVQQFHDWLKPDGLLFVHAPFWSIHWTRSTHLIENRKYSGDLKRIYTDYGFTALDASAFWDPILFKKSGNLTDLKASNSAAMRMMIGKLLLTPGRWNASVHMLIARMVARAPKHWVAALRALKDQSNST